MRSVHNLIKKAIQQALDEGKTQTEIARVCHVSQGTIYKYLTGEPMPDLDTLKKFSVGLRVPLEELLAEGSVTAPGTKPKLLLSFGRKPAATTEPAPEPAPMRPVPLLEAKAGQFPHRPWEVHADEVVWTDKAGEHLFAVRIKGDSMEPEFHEGEIVLIDPDVHVVPGPRTFVLVDCPLDGDGPILKQFRKLGEQLFFHALNPKHEPQDVPMTKKHRIIGKVVRRQQDY